MSSLVAWKEAAIAWAVCASIHRAFGANRDPLFRTRQQDFTRHEEEARVQYWKEVDKLAKKAEKRKTVAKKQTVKKTAAKKAAKKTKRK